MKNEKYLATRGNLCMQEN